MMRRGRLGALLAMIGVCLLTCLGLIIDPYRWPQRKPGADNSESLYEVYASELRTLLTTMSEAEIEALLLRAEPNAGEVLARLRFGESEIVVYIPELKVDDYPEMPKSA